MNVPDSLLNTEHFPRRANTLLKLNKISVNEIRNQPNHRRSLVVSPEKFKPLRLHNLS